MRAHLRWESVGVAPAAAPMDIALRVNGWRGVTMTQGSAPLPRSWRPRGPQDLLDPRIRVDQSDALYAMRIAVDPREPTARAYNSSLGGEFSIYDSAVQGTPFLQGQLPSVWSAAGAYDNALAKTAARLPRAECVADNFLFRTDLRPPSVTPRTLPRHPCIGTRPRLIHPLGRIPPAEGEATDTPR